MLDELLDVALISRTVGCCWMRRDGWLIADADGRAQSSRRSPFHGTRSRASGAELAHLGFGAPSGSFVARGLKDVDGDRAHLVCGLEA